MQWHEVRFSLVVARKGYASGPSEVEPAARLVQAAGAVAPVSPGTLSASLLRPSPGGARWHGVA